MSQRSLFSSYLGNIYCELIRIDLSPFNKCPLYDMISKSLYFQAGESNGTRQSSR